MNYFYRFCSSPMSSVQLWLVLFFHLFSASYADDVLGCNGFAKSSIEIDFSKVEVKLFTKQGSLKDHTECAPNNGYYFLPLYDRGEYILKVVPPLGWSFEPTEVPLSVDGVNDPCSQGKDINFAFKGFAITGKVVSSGHDVGPPGVKVELFLKVDNSNDKTGALPSAPVLSSETSTDGSFMFSPVLPGHYIIRISHSWWKISKSVAEVLVAGGNGEVPIGGLAVAGYDVSGTVTSDSQPITGVSFVLFSKKTEPLNVVGCRVEPLAGFSGAGIEGLQGTVPVCHVSSDSAGKFTFPQIPPGEYVLVPYYTTGARSTKFVVHPRTLQFTVTHGSLHLSTPFQVKGFTVSGRVLWSEGGEPIPNASVLIEGKPVAKTGSNGVYHLESIRAGTYNLQVKADGVEFVDKDVKVTATTLPDIIPDKYRVGGSLTPPIEGVKILIKSAKEGDAPSVATTNSGGSFSMFLPRGTYDISVQLDESFKSKGLQFSPAVRTVRVVDRVMDDINFSQLKCTIRGKIECLSAVCPLITVNLKPRNQGPTLQTIAKGGSYEFKEVIPGEYDVFILPGLGWCWTKESQSLNVISELTEAPTFTQSGFTVTIVSSHNTKVVYYRRSSSERNELRVSRGSTHVCVPSSGVYTFEPQGCHRYAEEKIDWVTGPVTLTALTHSNTIYIRTTHMADDLAVTVIPSDDSSSPPKKLTPVLAKSTDGIFKYELTLQLQEGEKVTLVPSANLLLFTPLTAELEGNNDCATIQEPLFTAEKGHVISGRVMSGASTGLEGVTINIVDEDGQVITTQETLNDGSYKFPPIRMTASYKVTAEKEGYVLTQLPDDLGNFSAHKLAEIIVTVSDKADNLPLQAVLLSLSGGESYRRNAQSNVNGTMSFLSLRPGEYFLRPMMKEYRFLPANKIIKVEEGATVKVELKGERVAFSCFGQVTSLNGEGETGVVVEAVGVGNCSIFQEEATSGPTGHFRIRGLQPNCEYDVRMKQGPEINQHILKASPDNILVKVVGSDVEGLRLYAMRPITRTDITVYVVAESPEELRTLRVRLSRESEPESTVYAVKLADYRATSGYALKSAVLTLAAVPADGRGYIVRLESSLSSGTHSYTLRPVHLKADAAHRLVRLKFAPRRRPAEPDLWQPSYLAVPLVLVAVLAYCHRDSLRSAAAVLLNAGFTPLPVPRAQASDDSGSDTFPDPVPKRKTKSRKT